jgi:PIN domain nuclease of toxin-antitoxin system
MNALLDTHVFLWWVTDDARLSARAREVIGDGSNAIYVSTASAWEIAIKARLGKLRLPSDPGAFFRQHLALNDFEVLPVALSHALGVYALPDLHRDPFDRMLVAQCQVESLALVTADAMVAGYAVEMIW